MQTLSITTIQSKMYWEDIPSNLQHFEEKLSLISGQTDLIVLPEMFTTGFSMNASSVAETMEGTTVDWLRKHSKNLDAVITGSVIIKEKGHFYNRLIWMQPDGKYQVYDKRHLFSLADEHLTYTPGKELLITEWRDWKICPLICYDLRFPAWSRNTHDYDLLIYMANWPVPRANAWKTLLEARAIENQSYTIGVNRVGKDEKGNEYSGDTSVIDYSGKVLYRVSGIQDVFTTILSKELQQNFRKKLNFLADRDEFEIIV